MTNRFKHLPIFFVSILLPFLIVIWHPADVQSESGNQNYAASDYQAYLKSPHKNPSWDPFVSQGFEALDRQDVQTSIEFLRKAHNLGCQSPLVLFKLALGYEALGSYYSAIQYYELARDSFGKSNRGHRYRKHFDENYGRALYLMGQKDKALVILRKAIRKSDSPWILRLLGDLSLEKGNDLEATAYYERLLRLENHGLTAEDQMSINLTLARMYRNKNEPAAATRYYERVLTLDPNHQEAREYIRFTRKGKSSEKMLDRVMEIFERH